jgi:hypothetical protein
MKLFNTFKVFSSFLMTVTLLTPNITVAATPSSGVNGHLDGVFSETNGLNACVKGWAFYGTDHNAAVPIEIWVDGVRNVGRLHSSIITNVSRPDVNAAFGLGDTGLHGFGLCLSDDHFDGKLHTIYAYAQEKGGEWKMLAGSPVTFQDTLNARLVGSFDGVITNTNDPRHPAAVGWAYDKSHYRTRVPLIFTLSPLPVTGINSVGSGMANVYRPDLLTLFATGDIAFNATLDLVENNFASGTKIDVYAYALDINDGRLKLIGIQPYITP